MPQDSNVVVLSEGEARTHTNEIKKQLQRHAETGERVLGLLREADEHEAWKALGYQSMARYIAEEFGYSRSNAYNIIDQYESAKRITVAPLSSAGQLPTQREATRDRQDEAIREDVSSQIKGAPLLNKRRGRQGPRGLIGVLDTFERSIENVNASFEEAGDDALSYLDHDQRRAFERTITHLFEFSTEWAERLAQPVTQREVDEWAGA